MSETNKNQTPAAPGPGVGGDAAIVMKGVSKRYRLGQIGYGTLQADFQSWWARRRGREDPNRKLTARTDSGEFFALRDVDLTVYRGETLGIIGRNGSGKSTLLKLISRVTAPTTGEIDIWGRVSSLLEVGTGFNLQMTGRENVYLNGAILGMSRAEIEQNLESIIAFSEVGEFIDTPVKRYSSGMKVKLGFAVAAHLTCEIMIMDEVLAVGDAAFKRKSLEKLHETARESDRTVLYVSHDMETVRQLCSRCIVLEAGQIVYDGETDGAIAVYLERGAQPQ
ncbi:MAG: ABC transporter ATP-binding protein [Oscillospiraceae bacterium]|nr:ABC transporter ATP-binding protein [Oscillospiraceae bacterium]